MICICNNVKSWIDFWHKRHFHIVSTFRGFFMTGVNLAVAGQAGMRCQQSHKLLSLVDAVFKDISAQVWQDELYRATIENCTTERGWAHNQAQKIANEHRAQENRFPRYLADLQNGNPWLEEFLIISINLSQKKIQAMISHQHQNVDKAMDVDEVDKVAEEESNLELYCHALYHIINLKLHPQDNRLKMCCNALYHPINLKLYPQDNRLKMCCNALYHPINLNLKLKHHPQHRNQHPSLQSSPFLIMFLWQLDRVVSILMHNSYMGH